MAWKNRALLWFIRSIVAVAVATDLLVASRPVTVYWRHGVIGLRHYLAFLHIERDMFRPRSCEELVTEALRGYETSALIFIVLGALTYLAFRWWRKYERGHGGSSG